MQLTNEPTNYVINWLLAIYWLLYACSFVCLFVCLFVLFSQRSVDQVDAVSYREMHRRNQSLQKQLLEANQVWYLCTRAQIRCTRTEDKICIFPFVFDLNIKHSLCLLSHQKHNNNNNNNNNKAGFTYALVWFWFDFCFFMAYLQHML